MADIKVKIFSKSGSTGFTDLESDINKWLEDHVYSEVISIQFTESMAAGGLDITYYSTSAMVIYKP